MDPWSKVDYSRHIRQVSMAMEKLPKVNPPSGRVPGQRLLAAPILKRRQWRNGEGIGKKAQGEGEAPKGEPPLRGGAGTASPGSPDLETAAMEKWRRDREKGLWCRGFRGGGGGVNIGGRGQPGGQQGAWGPGGSPLAP